MVTNSNSISLEHCHQFARRVGGLFGGFRDTSQEELHPRFPATRETHFLQQTVIIVSPAFEEQAEIQNGLTQHARVTQQQRDQETSKAPIAIKERMDRLELHMGEPSTYKRRHRRIIRMQKPFECA
jgi:hypothetical protein